MTKKMLIDATQAEETRVAIIDNNRLEEFDYESAMRKPLKGNIYLAKVTRVEPSLQAAFVSYGGNRHGFLPFSEIHPDYFRIPVADQEEFERMQREQLEEHDKLEAEEEQTPESADNEDESASDNTEDDNNVETVDEVEDHDAEDTEERSDDEDDKSAAKSEDEDEDSDTDSEESSESDNDADNDSDTTESDNKDEDSNNNRRGRGRGGRGRGRGRGRRSAYRSRRPENFGDDEAGQAQRFRFNLRRKYKIQEVVKRGQIMLIQVAREERGNKGAAVSTYLSLPGRYCVLMPNSPRGGGVSRKISNQQDRTKMKGLLEALQVPAGMSTIVRTAGVTRTKTEVKRDLDYLMRLWNSIRETTLQSTAPALVYEEANLIKRSVRDQYTRDIEKILVAGEKGYKSAKAFMKMLMPSHAKRVELYDDTTTSLFQKHQVESQIAEIGETEVTLPSGGYLVINPTEALVSVDVNSGRATKERNIEGTALKTNLEAAEEVARQLRLRDLGGLVVIDFIDMEDRRNNGKVERKMRDALSNDRARIQVGRISSFGLMELSRQRLNASLSEAQFETCPHCEGRGRVRTADSASLLVLRSIEAEGVRQRAAQVIAHVPAHVALYILNHKRTLLSELESRYNLEVLIRVDDTLSASSHRVEVSKPITKDTDGEENSDTTNKAEAQEERTDKNKRSRRGRGGRNKGRTDNQDQSSDNDNTDQDNADTSVDDALKEDGKDDDKDAKKPRRRNTRRKVKIEDETTADTSPQESNEAATETVAEAQEEEKPKKTKAKPRKPAKSKATKASKDKATEDKPAEPELKAVPSENLKLRLRLKPTQRLLPMNMKRLTSHRKRKNAAGGAKNSFNALIFFLISFRTAPFLGAVFVAQCCNIHPLFFQR